MAARNIDGWNVASNYDFELEAKRVIEAIEPARGALMTVMCALREAYAAGAADGPAMPVGGCMACGGRGYIEQGEGLVSVPCDCRREG